MKIICGFQTGVDIAAARAAKLVGLETGGSMPSDWRTVNGPRPEYAALYNATATLEPSYSHRTWRNVQEANAVWRIAAQFDSPGQRLTLTACQRLGRPYLDIPIVNGSLSLSERVSALGFLMLHKPAVLNIAGNRDADLESSVEEFLVGVFNDWLRLQP